MLQAPATTASSPTSVLPGMSPSCRGPRHVPGELPLFQEQSPVSGVQATPQGCMTLAVRVQPAPCVGSRIRQA